jgi:hypothetical protein
MVVPKEWKDIGPDKGEISINIPTEYEPGTTKLNMVLMQGYGTFKDGGYYTPKPDANGGWNQYKITIDRDNISVKLFETSHKNRYVWTGQWRRFPHPASFTLYLESQIKHEVTTGGEIDVGGGMKKTAERCDDTSIRDQSGVCLKVDNCTKTNSSRTNCEKCDGETGHIQRSTNPPKNPPINYKYCEKILNCKTSNGLNNCTECNTKGGRIPADNGKSCEQILNCATSDGKSKCTECESKYYLSVTTDSDGAVEENGRCAKIAGFEDCNHSDGKKNWCTECNTKGGLILADNGKCQKIPNCAISDGISKCTECNTKGGWILADNGKSCEQILNCATSDGKSKCTECESKYYLKNGRCEPITHSAHCRNSDGKKNECTSCNDNAYRTNTFRDPSCELCPDGYVNPEKKIKEIWPDKSDLVNRWWFHDGPTNCLTPKQNLGIIKHFNDILYKECSNCDPDHNWSPEANACRWLPKDRQIIAGSLVEGCYKCKDKSSNMDTCGFASGFN